MRRDGALDRQLLPNETILWSGRPARGFPAVVALQSFQVLVTLVIGMIFVGIVVRISIARGGTLPLPFTVALSVLGISLLLALLRYATTAYAVTDRRVLIVRLGSWEKVRSLPFDDLPEVTLHESFGGRGTIVFGQHTLGPREEGDPLAPRFLGIADARRVFRLIQERTAMRTQR